MATSYSRGFTIVEILAVLVVVAILAGVTIVGYGAWQRSSAENTITSDLIQAQAAMNNYRNFEDSYPISLNELSDSFVPSKGVSLSLTTEQSDGQPIYSGLSSVQNAVLFHEICRQIMSEDEYSTLYSLDGSATSPSYNLWCGSADGVTGINDDGYQINSWNSTYWPAPVTKAHLENRVADPPTDSWWDIATLDSATYQALIDRFEAGGGTFPITVFWDSWCDGCPWGTPLQPLPTPASPQLDPQDGYCIQATSQRYGDVTSHITSRSSAPIDGPC